MVEGPFASPPRPSTYLPGLDGLRAISVVAVVLYHAQLTWIPGGFLGVEVFFVISGYLITLLLTNELTASSTISLRGFWLRRARRLLPALYLLLAVVAAAVLGFYREETADLAAQVWSALGYSTNWYFIVSEQSYFALVERPPVFQHLWSLAIEEQFYLVWPLALLGLSKLLAGRRIAMAFLILGVAAASLIWMSILFDPVVDPSRVHYGTDTRSSGLMMGAALALLWRPEAAWSQDRRGKRMSLDVVGGAASLVLLSTFLRVGEFDPFLYRGGFAVVSISTLLVIMAAVHPSTVLGRVVLSQPVLTWIGLRSYALYLWHWPIFVFTRPGIDQPLGTLPTLAIRLALTVAAAELSYGFVEVPIRNGAIGRWRARATGYGWVRRRLSPIAAGVAAGLLLVAVNTLAVDGSRAEQQLVGQVVVAPEGSLGPGDAERAPGAPAEGEPADTRRGQGRAGTSTTTSRVRPPVDATVTMIGDSVLVGAGEQMTTELAADGYTVDYRAQPAWMLDEASAEIEAEGRAVGSTVIVGLGHNSIWERDRANFADWAREFDLHADDLLQTLRRFGAKQIVWVTLREPSQSNVPEMGERQFEQYVWYFPYVNERLDALVQRNPDVVLADWAAVSNRPDVTYDAMHLTGQGIRLMIDTIRTAGKI